MQGWTDPARAGFARALLRQVSEAKIACSFAIVLQAARFLFCLAFLEAFNLVNELV